MNEETLILLFVMCLSLILAFVGGMLFAYYLPKILLWLENPLDL